MCRSAIINISAYFYLCPSFGYILENGKTIISEKPMSLDEKEFILNFILKDIIYSSGSLITVEPDYTGGEIDAESGMSSGLSPDLQ